MQYDEALFVSAIVAPDEIEYNFEFFGHKVPIMLMTYLGTLKAWLYAPLLALINEPSRMLLRAPMLCLAGISVGLFYLLLRRMIVQKWVALLGALLLATDASYLLTSVYDWGPVAIQHVLFIGAMYAVVRYVQDGSRWWLFSASLGAGLAMWDKALFIWVLAGMGAALLAVFPRHMWQLMKDRRALGAIAGGLVLGALPLIQYNTFHGFDTFGSSNTQMGLTRELAVQKIVLLDRTLDGAGLFGYLARGYAANKELAGQGWEKIPVAVSRWIKGPERSYQVLLFAVVAFALPLVLFGPYGRLALLFALGGALTYLPMFLSKEAGGSTHHVILLYPIPQVLTSLVLAELIRRLPRRGLTIAAAVALAACGSNLAVTNHYLACLIRYGPSVLWTDANFALAVELGKEPGYHIFAADWGISQPVKYFAKGRISFNDFPEFLADEGRQEHFVQEALADPKAIVVTHAEGAEAYPGSRQRLFDRTAQLGYRPELRKVIHDRYDVPIFEIYVFKR